MSLIYKVCSNSEWEKALEEGFYKGSEIDIKDEVAGRGEFIITKDKFNKLKEEGDIKNTRNIVAGVFNSKKPNLLR